MKSLQMKYNLLHIIFWASYCAIYGYVTLYLQYKGLSNTEIGLVTGIGAALSIFTSPLISGLVNKVKGLTIKMMILITYISMIAIWVLLTFFNLPAIIIMVIYIAMINLIIADVPLLTMICMNYLKTGEYINFGLSRGMGSVAYATSAVVLGRLIEFINADVLAYVFVISSILLFILINTFPDVEVKENQNEEGLPIPKFILKYKTFFMILCAFTFLFAGTNALGIYLVNIVKNLGGSTSMYGIAVFCMAASELPFMSITHYLLKKFKSEQLLLFASLMFVIRNVTISNAPILPILLVGMLCQGASYGLFTAVITYYTNDNIDSQDNMTGQTMIGMMSTGLGACIGSILGGILQDALGIQSLFLFAQACTIIGFIFMFITLLPHLKRS